MSFQNHSGGLGGGHYTAAVLGPDGGWYNCNDSSVRAMDAASVCSEEAYLLFYKRRGSSASVPSSLSSADTDAATGSAEQAKGLDEPE